jgi:hypothetical protein
MRDAVCLSYICSLTTVTGHETAWNITRVYFQESGYPKLIHSHLSMVGHEAPPLVELPILARTKPEIYQGTLSELMLLESKAMYRWRNGDPWGFIENSADDVSYMDSGTTQRVDGKPALSANYAQIEGKIFYEVMDFVDPDVHTCQDMAVLFYRFVSTRLYPDGSVSTRTPWFCTEVFDRSTGDWLVRHNHWSLIHGVKPSI